MREILFRGKRTDNGEWWVGDLMHTGKKCSIRRPKPNDPINYEFYWVAPETVGQFTGLTDANGKNIFEGDIVKTHYANAVKADFVELVVFNNGKYCGMCKLEGGGRMYAPLADGVPHVHTDKSVYMDRVEVIGNIHDNPELLNEREAEK